MHTANICKDLTENSPILYSLDVFNSGTNILDWNLAEGRHSRTGSNSAPSSVFPPRPLTFLEHIHSRNLFTVPACFIMNALRRNL